MITVQWTGTFKAPGKKDHVSKLSFSGDSLEDVSAQIREFVECLEDGKEGWCLEYSAVTDIKNDT